MFSELAAVFGIREIMAEKVSRADIAMLYIDLQQAKKNLSAEEFEDVLGAYKYYRRQKVRLYMDDERLLRSIIYIITEINCMAPYEKCCGKNGAKILGMLKMLRENEIALF